MMVMMAMVERGAMSQTAPAACQPLKIAGRLSVFWAYSQKAIKITSSLLSSS